MVATASLFKKWLPPQESRLCQPFLQLFRAFGKLRSIRTWATGTGGPRTPSERLWPILKESLANRGRSQTGETGNQWVALGSAKPVARCGGLLRLMRLGHLRAHLHATHPSLGRVRTRPAP